MGWEVAFRESPDGPIELPGLLPTALAGCSTAEVEHWLVRAGNRRQSLGDYATVRPLEDDRRDDGPTLVLSGPIQRVNRLGQGMDGGYLRVEGSLGHGVGAGMSGGQIEVKGNVEDRAGQAMTGGILRIWGRAGHELGAARPGQIAGIREGVILVGGDAGDDVGLAMRRGLIAIAGACGRRAGRSMIAGTIVSLGGIGPDAGVGMKRGTVLLGQSVPTAHWPSFRWACRYDPPFVRVYLRTLLAMSFTIPEELLGAEFDRYNGDVLEGGHGEILMRAAR